MSTGTPLAVETSTLKSAELDAIANGSHDDIFSCLGLHPSPTGTGLVLRAYVPEADKVVAQDCVSGRTIVRLRKVHPAGVFEAVMPRRRKPFPYRLEVSCDDYKFVADDPYRFPTLLDNDDVYLFCEGTGERCHEWMGAHQRCVEGVEGVWFTLWAPNARRVAVIGEFNYWDPRRHPMRKQLHSGIWEIFIPGVADLELYKFHMVDARGRTLAPKSDPFARSMQHPPETASRVVYDSSYVWTDELWVAQRQQRQQLNQPLSVYEVHAGSWRRRSDEGNRYLSYLELADELLPYVEEMGFTHIQLLPVSEYPFDGSWGYQPVGMFAPTIRFGTPDELREFVNRCHERSIGVLLDWVPGHFPTDEHGLGRFDGTCLYEHEDKRKGFHPDWNTLIYNYGRAEVVSFLIANAHYWLDQFHIDGLRVDAVASMLYLDYSREAGEWLPNEQGGRENLEAMALLRTVNQRVEANFPGVLMIAEESTAWPGVTRPVADGGLGFSYKWNMGWMNDSLRYIERDPIHRRYHHDEMTFSIVYAYSENFILPLSHDEVVHGKRSLLEKMPGDDWQKFANLRAFLAYMWGHPGKKLLFMGSEFAQRREWNHDRELDWELLDQPLHQGLQSLVRDLNHLYRDVAALYGADCSPEGFEWVQADNRHQSVFAWLRRHHDTGSTALVVSNLTPGVHYNYQVGVPAAGRYVERLNSDSELYGGGNVGNVGGLLAEAQACNGQAFTLTMTLPPLATLIFTLEQAT